MRIDAHHHFWEIARGDYGWLTPDLGAIHRDFTVADLNVASILAWARPAQIDMAPFPRVAEWLKNCAERPAARAVRQMQRE